MILLLEGPDNGGKSSIMQELRRMHEYGILVEKHITVDFKKMTFREDNKVERTLDLVEASKAFHLNIWDRCYYPSDLIYNPTVEGKPSVIQPHRNLIEYNMLLVNTIIVFVTAEIPTLMKRLASRGDEYVAESQIKSICLSYLNFFKETPLPWYVVNTTNEDVYATTKQVADIIDRHLGGA